mgnify:CR=1 FL=1
MSFFQISFLTDLRVRLTRWRTWALVLLLPLLIFFAARILPAEEVSTPVQVGVVLPETGGGDFWRRQIRIKMAVRPASRFATPLSARARGSRGAPSTAGRRWR